MIGPLTLQVGKAVDEFTNMLGSAIVEELVAGEQDEELMAREQDIDFIMPRVPVFTAAYAVCKGDMAHPKILWGNFWFLYYQAWLWRCSKGWREDVTEVWLRRLHDKGELEQLELLFKVPLLYKVMELVEDK